MLYQTSLPYVACMLATSLTMVLSIHVGTQLIPDSQSFVALGPVKLTTIPQLSTSTHGHVTSYWSFLSIMMLCKIHPSSNDARIL